MRSLDFFHSERLSLHNYLIPLCGFSELYFDLEYYTDSKLFMNFCIFDAKNFKIVETFNLGTDFSKLYSYLQTSKAKIPQFLMTKYLFNTIKNSSHEYNRYLYNYEFNGESQAFEKNGISLI